MAQANNEQPRVVVTGIGAVTAQGPTAYDLWDGVKACRVAIRPVEHLSMDGLRTRLGGEVQDYPEPKHEYPHPDGFRDRAMDFALVAAEEAFESGGANTGTIPAERWGVVVGTCNAGLLSAERWYLDTADGAAGDKRLLVTSTPQAIAETLAGAFGLEGPAVSIDTACAAGANAIGYGADLIRSGQADAVLAGGTDAFSDVLYAGFNSLESLSPKPAAPYSEDREGLSLGEGSGMCILMSDRLAREADLPVLAEVLGNGLSADGYHPTAPHPEGKGAARAVRAALRFAGVDADDVDYVNSHGTGTAKNDPAETKATRLGLGAAAERVAVSSTKSMIGHLLGAAGAVEGIVSIQALRDQVAPPTANFTRPDPECDLDYVPNEARPMSIDVAVSNNFAFGGANASIVLAREGGGHAPPPPPALDRVVITGRATLTPAGDSIAALWDAVTAGTSLGDEEQGVRVARTSVELAPHLSKREARRMDRLGIFAVVAAKVALNEAGLEVDDSNRERVGAIFATGLGPMETMERFARPLFDEGPIAANPALFPNTVYNAAGGQVAMRLGTIGPASTITSGHAAGLSGVCYAYDLCATDHGDAIITTAADTLTDTVVRGYRDVGGVAPADGSRDGFVLADAGAALVVERRAHAQSRGARMYGEILGRGLAGDGMGPGRWDPSGAGLERAVRRAMEEAGVDAGDIQAVWSGLCGWQTADAPEEAALQRLFGDRLRDGLPVHAPKRVVGETIGVGGVLNVALALEDFARGGTSGPVLATSSSLGGTHFAVVLAPAT